MSRSHFSTRLTDDECRSIIFKEPVQDKVIKGHLIRAVEVPNRGSCDVTCYMEPNCVSINIGPSPQAGTYICELNNATDDNKGSRVLQSKKDYIYLGIEVKYLMYLMNNPSFKLCAFRVKTEVCL